MSRAVSELRPLWLGLAIACGVYILYTAWQTWRYLYVISDGHRLLNIGLIIAFGVVGGECWKRALRRR